MSSKETLDDAFPIVCERCGQRAALPTTERTHGDIHVPQHVRCAVCNHVSLVAAPNGPITFQRKPDRRATPRDEET